MGRDEGNQFVGAVEVRRIAARDVLHATAHPAVARVRIQSKVNQEHTSRPTLVIERTWRLRKGGHAGQPTTRGQPEHERTVSNW